MILVSAERARDFPQKPVYLLGTGESVETPMVSQMADFTSSRAFRVAGPKAFAEAGITHNDVDHLMIYDAFAHLPIYGLEDLGFVPRGEAGAFIAERNTAPGGKLPLNTNGGGLSYMHSGMYGMYALQESVRQMRGTAPAQIPGAKISVCHGVGGMFAASRHDHHVERGALKAAGLLKANRIAVVAIPPRQRSVSYAVRGKSLTANVRRAWIMTTASDKPAAPQIFIGSPPT